MNNYHKTYKGVTIKPSARPSIHSHNYCPFDERYRMGRHGLIKNKYNIANASLPVNQHDEGTDEVDNVMSKFAHPIQIPTRGKNKTQRRSSLDLNTQDFTSDDSNILSKSLPTSLQTQPCCSDDSSSDQDSAQKTDSSNQSFHILNNNISRNESAKQGETSFTKSQHYMRKNDNILERNRVYLWFVVIPVILAVLGVTYLTGKISIFQNKSANDDTVKDIYDRQKFYNALSNIGEKYKVNNDTILQLQSGISLISERRDTASFVFVYNSEATNFATEMFNEFVNEVASVAARYLRNESSTVRHVVVDSSRLFLQNSIELTEKYRLSVTRSGVLLLMEIDKLPSSLAKDLHYYCDEFNPLVKKSAIFSTLDLANCSDRKPTHAHIEKCLTKKWNSVSADNIGPLLARVVSIVVDLTNDF